eukprot:GHVH01002119.1.p2 GENE.GHVH01002119.1~~GHVH01002119.1.p2  ORF type:complete len:125 (+),score=15.82 GHVH01002119.1:792-1166(+)
MELLILDPSLLKIKVPLLVNTTPICCSSLNGGSYCLIGISSKRVALTELDEPCTNESHFDSSVFIRLVDHGVIFDPFSRCQRSNDTTRPSRGAEENVDAFIRSNKSKGFLSIVHFDFPECRIVF